MNDQPTGYRKTAVRGATITGMAQMIRVGLQIASAVVLARLLLPEDFGIIAMVAPIVAFVTLFQDLGLQQAIVQNRDITAAQISRLFWINMLMGAIVAVTLVLIAPLVGWFYDDHRVVPVTIAWTIPVLLGAFAAQHLTLLNRDLRFTVLATSDILSGLVTLLSGLFFAWWLKSYWALVFSMALGSLTTVTVCWSATRWRPLSPFAKADIGHLLRFGLNLAGFNIVNYFSRNLDNILIAKLFGPVPLGLYDRAYKLLLAPLSNINAPVGRVTLPILARLRDEPERYRNAYLQVAALLTWVCVPGITAAAIVSHDVVLLLLGKNWLETATIFGWLGIAGMTQPLGNATGWLFISQHRTKEMFQWSVLSGMTTIASFLIGIPWGVAGIAAAYAIGSVIRQPLLLWWVGRRGPVTTGDLMRLQLPVFLSAALSFFVVHWIGTHVALHPVINIFVSLTVSYGLALLMILLNRRTRHVLGASLAFLGPLASVFGQAPPAQETGRK